MLFSNPNHDSRSHVVPRNQENEPHLNIHLNKKEDHLEFSILNNNIIKLRQTCYKKPAHTCKFFYNTTYTYQGTKVTVSGTISPSRMLNAKAYCLITSILRTIRRNAHNIV